MTEFEEETIQAKIVIKRIQDIISVYDKEIQLAMIIMCVQYWALDFGLTEKGFEELMKDASRLYSKNIKELRDLGMVKS